MVGLRKCNNEVIECHNGRSHVFPHMQNLANNRYLWKPCTCGQSRIWKIDIKKGYILGVEAGLNVVMKKNINVITFLVLILSLVFICFVCVG